MINNPLSLNDPSGYCYGGPDTVSQMMMDRMLGMLESQHVANVTSAMGFFNRPLTITSSSDEGGTAQAPQTPQTTKDEDNSASQTQNTLDDASGDGNTSGQTNASTASNSNTAPNGESQSDGAGSVAQSWDDVEYPTVDGGSSIDADGVPNQVGVCDYLCQALGEFYERLSRGFTLSPQQVYRGLEFADYATMLNPYRFITRGAVKTSVIGPIQIGVAKSEPIWTKNARKGWSSVDNAFQHWKKHGTEFPEFKNAKQYAEGAKDFLHSPPVGTLSKVRSNGDVVRYNQSTNTFGIMDANGVPRTMYRPDAAKHGYPSNLDYFNAQ